jgi:hypothetical protein
MMKTMTHRDEQLAKDARVEAQALELDELRAELDLTRAAHAQKVREVEQLKRELNERGIFGTPTDSNETARRAFGLTGALFASCAMLSALGVMATMRVAPRPLSVATLPAMPRLETFRGRVERADNLPIEPGAACEVELRRGAHDCRVQVTCGGQVFYGASAESGFLRCDPFHLVDLDATARDGDPRMSLDLTEHRVMVSDSSGMLTQRLEIGLADELAESPRQVTPSPETVPYVAIP